MRIAVVLGLLGLLFLAPAPRAWAQGEGLTLKNMEVRLWPEYDDPRLLVIYEGEFADAASFPREVSFLIPKGAEINQVCAIRKPANEHLCQLYRVEDQGDSLLLTYTLPITTFFLEYYWDALQGQPERAFSYQLQSLYPIETLTMEVQEPLRSSNFSLTPTPAQVTADNQGFKYNMLSFTGVAARQPIQVKASYIKADTQPSVGKKTGQTGRVSPLLILGAGLAVAAVVGYLAFRRRPTIRRAPAGRRTLSAVPPQRPPKRSAPGASFCSQCGEPLQEDDKFCPICGRKVKGSL